MKEISHYLDNKLRLKVNPHKSGVAWLDELLRANGSESMPGRGGWLDTTETALPNMAKQEKVECASKNANEKRVNRGESMDISEQSTRSVVELWSEPHEPCIPEEVVLRSRIIITAGT